MNDKEDILKESEILLKNAIYMSILLFAIEFGIRSLLSSIVYPYPVVSVYSEIYSKIYYIIKEYRENFIIILGALLLLIFDGNIMERTNKMVYIILMIQGVILSALITLKIYN